MRPSLIRRALRAVLFTCQATALLVGIWVAHVATIYRPYVLCGNFMCSFSDEYYRTPPIASDGVSVDLDVALYVFQFVLIVWVTLMVLLLLQSGGTKKDVWTGIKMSIAGIIAFHVVLMFAASPFTWLFDGTPLVFKALLILASVGAIRLRLISYEEDLLRLSLDCSPAYLSPTAETDMEGGARKRREYLRRKAVAYILIVICGFVSYGGFAIAALVILSLRVSWPWMKLEAHFIEQGVAWVSGGLLVCCAGFTGGKRVKERADSLPYVPPVKKQIAALSANEILLRGSGQPAAAPNSLLRAAHKGTDALFEELLRPNNPTAGNDTQPLQNNSTGLRDERQVSPWQ